MKVGDEVACNQTGGSALGSRPIPGSDYSGLDGHRGDFRLLTIPFDRMLVR
ncbi:hypothetical protein [Nocardiopsis sp. NRRL B-16309]|uniref:hypothetical protein n=1 Tax=Nocardiopsis sp. NRRL B-16309 TaxID=1519494 RepID=UPI000A4FD55A|nr:hypothetical protein [Nocardiopsis sp. NRRL B-16309]